MSDDFEKYAVYWVPKRIDPLARFGASWTGWCSDRGERRDRGALNGMSIDTATITRRSRHHGFHGVIKASFRLGAGRSRFTLEHLLALLAEDSVAFQLPPLRLAVVDECVALVPSRNDPELGDLVARVDDALAPLDPATASEGFAEAQAVAVTTDCNGAGVADPVLKFPTAVAHRFRMPLTDPIGPALALEVMAELQPVLEPILHEPRQLDDLALIGDPGGGRPLRLLQRYDLHAWPQRQASSAMPCQGPHVLVSNFADPLAKTQLVI